MSQNESEQLNHMRHSAAHLLAAAVMELWPNTKRTIGPAIENGFYYDFDFGDVQITEYDLETIEKKMAEILSTWTSFEREEVNANEAKDRYKDNPYKIELIEEFAGKGETLTFYKSGNYEDLCRGGHSENPSKDIGAFKLLSIAGAYWRGNEKNAQLTRIYGTAWPTKQQQDTYLEMIEEARRRDHRKLGKELDLFVFSDLVGSGLPLFTPRGTVLREQLLGYSDKLQKDHGFDNVWIPHITKTELYKKSGHWDKFGDELFLVQSQETSDQFVMKPMNCPHHIQIYASQMRSYRDLPIRYSEVTTQYRDEKAGEMLGLSRVRSITIDDAHIFCRMDQIENEFENIMQMIKEMYATLGMEFKARLSFRDDSDKYLGDKANWEKAQTIIEDVAKKLELDYFVATGEAAFYGPKIDIMVYDALGREWQCATQQLDFVQPERFGIKYVDSDGTEKTPVMLHKALLGSIERFLSVYIEHTAGAFPTWLAPEQIRIIPVTDRTNNYAQELMGKLKAAGMRAKVDDRSERMQAKIREAQLMKVPYMLIVGDREAEADTVSVRTRDNTDLGARKFEDFLDQIQKSVEEKALDLMT